jgi:hypothetical protein
LEDTTIKDVLKTVQSLHGQKDYQGALKLLELHKSEISTGLWHYNVGTIYGKIENWPLARYHLLMADSEGFRSKELFNNILLVEEKIEAIKLEKPETTADYLVVGGITATQGVLTSVSLILVICGIIGLRKKVNLKSSMVFFSLSILVLGLNWWILSWNKKIVTVPQPLKDGPSAIFDSKGELPAGLLIVGEQKGEWMKIYYPSRFQGWIKNSGLEELK